MSPEAQYWVTVTKLTGERNSNLWAALVGVLGHLSTLVLDMSIIWSLGCLAFTAWCAYDAARADSKIASLITAGPPKNG